MRGRRWAALAAAIALTFGGGAVAVAQTSGPQPVTCSYDSNVLTCPITPSTVTETSTTSTTATVTADPITVTATATETSTAQPPTVTVPGPTVTVTTTRTVTTTPATSSLPSSSSALTSSSAVAQSASWPGASNTGVPSGTALTTFGTVNTCNLTTAGAVYDARTFNCDLVIKAAGIKVTRSQINGRIVSNSDNYPGASVSLTDSTINGGQQETFPTVAYTNVTLLRVNVLGGQHSVQCSANCTVTDSWLHGQYLPTSSAGHVNAFISNGGSGFTLTHNTLDCSVNPTASGGCTADASVFGDFSPISNVLLERNLFVANHAGYCLQAGYNPSKKYPNATGVVVRDNVFQRVGRDTTKCGLYGPVTAYNASAAGNSFTGNVYDDGTPVNP